MEKKAKKERRTAGDAGWRKSRYNLMARVPDTENIAIANLFKGTCAEYVPVEMHLFDALDELDENHPILKRFARRGIIVNFDERAVLESMGRAACARPHAIGLTICPTMGCNFDCPYCYEDHRQGKMSAEVQDDIIALATRMLDGAGTRNIEVVWFGGEPLLAPDVIEALTTRLLALCEQRGGRYSAKIITNGYLLTQETVDMLERCKVQDAQVTIDGIGATHDATRHLAGGGPTFERIVANLRDVAIPFHVSIRHNVHEGNMAEIDELGAFIEELAEESGNDLSYYYTPVSDSNVADKRGSQVGLLCSSDASEVSLRQEAERFRSGRGSYCTAHNIWSTGIDDKGNLQMCWEAVDKPQLSFGTARDWDPTRPFATASNVENLAKFLNTANPIPDEECRECAWLPLCVGGCPYKRLFEERQCVAFKDDPEAYVLALFNRIGREREPEDESQPASRRPSARADTPGARRGEPEPANAGGSAQDSESRTAEPAPMKYTERNGAIISSWKRREALPWMRPITHEEYLRAAAGEELMTLTGLRKVPFSWYGDCRGKRVLGLAAGGGQQMAIMSALGAECTLLDIAEAQIEADRMVSVREGYDIRLIRGDMTDPLPFADASFDMVVNPISNHYIEDVEPVFREIYRVLAPGGTLLAGLDTGIYWAFEPDGNGIIHSLPHNPMKDGELRKELLLRNEAYVFSHTLEEQIGGQLRAGFALKEILEDTHEDDGFGENNIPTEILTRSVKP